MLVLRVISMLLINLINYFGIYFLKQDYKQISEIMSKYSAPKKILSFADTSLIFLKNILNCEVIISFDNHFDGIIKRLF
jgi:predicted nucleic acid-binding protein